MVAVVVVVGVPMFMLVLGEQGALEVVVLGIHILAQQELLEQQTLVVVVVVVVLLVVLAVQVVQALSSCVTQKAQP
jgi:ABC-type nitrate/sulfonate/bicarbonate transport system permease component